MHFVTLLERCDTEAGIDPRVVVASLRFAQTEQRDCSLSPGDTGCEAPPITLVLPRLSGEVDAKGARHPWRHPSTFAPVGPGWLPGFRFRRSHGNNDSSPSIERKASVPDRREAHVQCDSFRSPVR